MTVYNQRLINHLHYILIAHWDPIGVNDEPNAQDEYDSYIPQLLSALATTDDSGAIAALLHTIETEWMGLQENYGHTHTIAGEIIAAYQLHQYQLIIPCYTRVCILTDHYRDEHAPCGTVGYVIEIHTPEAYEVECSSTDGSTFAQVVVHPNELLPVEATKNGAL